MNSIGFCPPSKEVCGKTHFLFAELAGLITFGVMQQILNAFDRVENSFQFLVNSWETVVELMSVYRRLRAFERAIEDAPNPPSGGEQVVMHVTVQ